MSKLVFGMEAVYVWPFMSILPAALILSAAFADVPLDEAAELTASAEIECSDGSAARLTDGNETTYTRITDGGWVAIRSEEEISSLYVIFDRIYGQWTLSDGETEVVCGQNLFLHEYVDVEELFGYSPSFLTLTFSGNDCFLSELHLFGEGELPAWVQRWEPPCEEADLLLASTHIDDEQLFFAGILPYYAGEQGLAVQVVYFTDPFSYHDRPHEQLNGLWTVGVRNYPVSGEFVDAYSESAQEAYRHQEQHGFEREDMVRFQVEMIRRFRPHVIVGHDIDGEYGHGQHMINSETLMEAVELAADADYDPDSVNEYGVWDTPKTYIHLWKENQIVMDWDTPLEAFDGKTAFQVSQEGFLCHKSQQWTWFRRWIFGSNDQITKASEIRSYSPCLYGLYRSKVGADSAGDDMFENIPQSYAQIRAEAAAAEELRRQEESAARSGGAEDGEIETESGDVNPGESYTDGEGSNHIQDSPEMDSGEESWSEPAEEGEGEKQEYGIVAAVMVVAAAVITLLILLAIFKGRPRKG